MPRLVVALASCSDALETAPLFPTGAIPGVPTTPVWLGRPSSRSAAVDLGLPAHAADDVDVDAYTWVLLAGSGPAVQRFGLNARQAGAMVLRWNAGQRCHDAGGDDGERRLVDHLAHRWLCASTWQRDELLREGAPAAHVCVVGSAMPAALRTVGVRRASAPRGVWLALEHRRSVAAAAPLRQLLQRVADAAARSLQPVRAGATVLGPALSSFGVELPAGFELAACSPKEQLQAALDAAVVLTDSAGYQELAAAAGIPCVLLAASTARPETVAAGACRLAGPNADLPAAVAEILAAPPVREVYADAMVQLPAASTALIASLAPQPPDALPATAPAALPNDGDHTGRTLGDEEALLAAAAIRSGTLNSTRGTRVAAFERQFAQWLGCRHAIACANGSAAVHAALAALDLQAGDEVVTTPITDMGALTPILYQGAVPVFADVDARTYNVTAASIAAQLTDRTRAVVVTHLFGLPAELDAILEVTAARGIAVIEDGAQAFGARHRDRKVGTWGRLAAFSLQQGKHITCGEGGVVATDDDDLARRVFLFVNKAWGYGDARPDHYFPALNYRLTELQGAVLLGQLPKLDGVVARRRQVAAALREQLRGLAGLGLPDDPAHGTHSYWKFALDVDPTIVRGGTVALGRGLQEQGIACAPRYVQKPAFACELFKAWRRSPITSMPLAHNPRGAQGEPWPAPGDLPGAAAALERVLVLPLNERYLPQHVDRVAAAIRARHEELTRG